MNIRFYSRELDRELVIKNYKDRYVVEVEIDNSIIEIPISTVTYAEYSSVGVFVKKTIAEWVVIDYIHDLEFEKIFAQYGY